MKCSNCGNEMETGYALQLGAAGTIRVVKSEAAPASGRIAASVCPNCGKTELFVDYESIK